MKQPSRLKGAAAKAHERRLALEAEKAAPEVPGAHLEALGARIDDLGHELRDALAAWKNELCRLRGASQHPSAATIGNRCRNYFGTISSVLHPFVITPAVAPGQRQSFREMSASFAGMLIPKSSPGDAAGRT